jgi:anti-sigma regulatory factor (Ser/Thr protein kinase)
MLGQTPTPHFPSRLSGDDAYKLARGAWTPQANRSFRIELDGTLGAVADARRAIELHLGGVLDEDDVRDACLLASELVTNAVVHGEGRSGVVMHLAAAARGVRVEVCDGGLGFDFPLDSRSEGVLGGLGLRILDATASRWGVAGDDGTCVWFELELDLDLD